MCDALCALAAATAEGVTLLAKNSDRPPQEPQAVEWHSPRRERTTRATHLEIAGHGGETVGFVGSRPTWMWGVEHGVNVAGVAIGNEMIFTDLDPRPAPDGLVGMDLVRLGLERARTADAAVEVITGLLEHHGQGGTGRSDGHHPYWSSFLVADPATAFVIETSGRTWAAERVDRSRAISNRTTIAGFDAVHRHPRQPVEALVDPRWRASRAVLAAGPVDVEGLRRHLRSHVGGQDGWTVCMHVAGVEATTAAMVAELPGSGRPVARFLLGSPCTSVFVPVVVGHPLGQPPAWDRFARLGPGHRSVLDDLEAALEDDCTDDAAWNAEAWRRVTAVLDQLAIPAVAAP
jgi:hypothetical protein